VVFKLFAGVCPAFADAIDGQWCLGSSRVEKWTEDADAGENEITDNDDRHGLDDVVGNEEGAGMQIVMALLARRLCASRGGLRH